MNNVKQATGLALVTAATFSFAAQPVKLKPPKLIHRGLPIHATAKQKKPARADNKTQKQVSFAMHQGSLFNNVKAFAKQYHYRLIWNVINPTTNQAADFHVVDNLLYKAKTPAKLLEKITTAYPVRTIAWQGNHVICMTTNGVCNGRQSHA